MCLLVTAGLLTTYIGGWTGYGYWQIANNSVIRYKLKGEV